MDCLIAVDDNTAERRISQKGKFVFAVLFTGMQLDMCFVICLIETLLALVISSSYVGCKFVCSQLEMFYAWKNC